MISNISQSYLTILIYYQQYLPPLPLLQFLHILQSASWQPNPLQRGLQIFQKLVLIPILVIWNEWSTYNHHGWCNLISIINTIIIISSISSSNCHPCLLPTKHHHFFRSLRSSTLDFHFLSHYSYIKAIMLYKGNHWTHLLATCIPYGYNRISLQDSAR